MSHYYRESHTGKIIGAGVFGVLLGAVAALFLAPKSGRETREDFSNWTESMNKDLQNRLRETRNLTQEKYNQLVDNISEKYRKARSIKENELDDFIEELKMRWERIKNQWNEN